MNKSKTDKRVLEHVCLYVFYFESERKLYCISVSNLTLVPSCAWGGQTGSAPLGAWRHLPGDTEYRRVGLSDTSPHLSRSLCGRPCARLGAWTPGIGAWWIIGLFLENNWCCVSIRARRERRTSPPSEGKAFYSSPKSQPRQAELRQLGTPQSSSTCSWCASCRRQPLCGRAARRFQT